MGMNGKVGDRYCYRKYGIFPVPNPNRVASNQNNTQNTGKGQETATHHQKQHRVLQVIDNELFRIAARKRIRQRQNQGTKHFHWRAGMIHKHIWMSLENRERTHEVRQFGIVSEVERQWLNELRVKPVSQQQ